MNAESIHISCPGNAHETKITMGGQPLQMVTSCDVAIRAGEVAEARLGFWAPVVDATIPAEKVTVVLPLPGGDVEIPLAELLKRRDILRDLAEGEKALAEGRTLNWEEAKTELRKWRPGEGSNP